MFSMKQKLRKLPGVSLTVFTAAVIYPGCPGQGTRIKEKPAQPGGVVKAYAKVAYSKSAGRMILK